MEKVKFESALSLGKLWSNDLPMFLKSKGREFRIDGHLLILKRCPNFTSPRKFRNWIKNHLPKKRLERFLTASLKKGKVRIEVDI